MRALNFTVEVSFNGELKLTGRHHHHRSVPTLFVGHKIQLLAGFTGGDGGFTGGIGFLENHLHLVGSGLGGFQ